MATKTAQPVTLEGLPGRSVTVAAGADRERPARPYRLRVARAYDIGDGWVFASGTLEQLDGTPSTRPHPYNTRAAHLMLEGLTYAEAADATSGAAAAVPTS